ncbi:MAG: energy-coupling factor transporter ATPase [Chloroflexota bacterium]
MSAPRLLEAERLSYWYPGLPGGPALPASPPLATAALKEISLAFEPGEFVLLVGPSGSGKSTLIQALLGVVPALTGGAVGGQVRLEGVPVLERGLAGVAGRAGLVLQDPESQLTNLDVEGEVLFGPENLGLPRDEIERRLHDSLRIAGIEALRQRFVYALSGGQKQRVAIAAGLAMQPRILLMDSPTSNLDPLGSEETLRAIVDLWQHGTVELIVMAAHKIDDVLPFATRLIVLDGGRVVLDGPPATILADHLFRLKDELGVFVPEVCEIAVSAGLNDGALPTSADAALAMLRERLPPSGPGEKEAREQSSGSPPINEPAVSVRDVHFAYSPSAPVLRGIDLQVPRGQFLALLGQNGTGKTTLAKNIAGLYRPSKGAISVVGHDVGDGVAHLASGRVGYVFQYPDHQFVATSVAEELAYGLHARNADPAEIEARVSEMLALFHLEDHREAPPYRLSMGEKRRLSVATMLILRPDVLILDEPTTGQDRRNTVALMEILRAEVHARGMTVIQITHDMEQAAEFADRVVVMDGGQVVFDGSVGGLFERHDLLQQCHLKPTPTAAIAQRLWPDARGLPTLPRDLADRVREPSPACR